MARQIGEIFVEMYDDGGYQFMVQIATNKAVPAYHRDSIYLEYNPHKDEDEEVEVRLTENAEDNDMLEFEYNDSLDGDFDTGMASAGLGTDEDYNGWAEDVGGWDE